MDLDQGPIGAPQVTGEQCLKFARYQDSNIGNMAWTRRSVYHGGGNRGGGRNGQFLGEKFGIA